MFRREYAAHFYRVWWMAFCALGFTHLLMQTRPVMRMTRPTPIAIQMMTKIDSPVCNTMGSVQS